MIVGNSDSDGDSGNRVLILFDPEDAGELAIKLAEDLRSRGCVVDPHAVGQGSTGWPESGLNEALNRCAVVIALLTPGAVEKPKGSCLEAISEAVSLRKRIVPAMVELCRPPLAIYRLNWLDLQRWRDAEQYASAVERLVLDLEVVERGDERPDSTAPATPAAEQVETVGAHREPGVRVMISYGRNDAAELARKLRTDLTDRGFMYGFNEFELRAGRSWEDRIEQSILAADVVVALLTPHAVRRPDGVCPDEIALARSEGGGSCRQWQ